MLNSDMGRSNAFDCTSPTVIGFVGPNGSGKSSIIESLGFEGVRPGNPFFTGRITFDPETGRTLLPIINPDEIAKAIAFNKPEMSLEECNRLAMEESQTIRQLYADAGIDFAFETVGSHPSKVDFFKQVKRRGYTVGILFVGTEDSDINVRRVEQRVRLGGHDVPVEKIHKRYQRAMGLLPQYYEVADYMTVYDNSIDKSKNSGFGSDLLLVKKGDVTDITQAGNDSPWLKKYLLDFINTC